MLSVVLIPTCVCVCLSKFVRTRVHIRCMRVITDGLPWCLRWYRICLGSIPGSRRLPGEGNGYPLQYSCLENPADRGAWQATVQGVAELDTTERLSSHTRFSKRRKSEEAGEAVEQLLSTYCMPGPGPNGSYFSPDPQKSPSDCYTFHSIVEETSSEGLANSPT